MLNAEKIKKTLEGFKESNRIIEEERKRRLQSMTIEESSRIYDDLCDFYYSQPRRGDEKKLDELKIEFLFRRRKILDTIAERMSSDEYSK